jgi:hypothetical protein
MTAFDTMEAPPVFRQPRVPPRKKRQRGHAGSLIGKLAAFSPVDFAILGLSPGLESSLSE